MSFVIDFHGTGVIDYLASRDFLDGAEVEHILDQVERDLGRFGDQYLPSATLAVGSRRFLYYYDHITHGPMYRFRFGVDGESAGMGVFRIRFVDEREISREEAESTVR